MNKTFKAFLVSILVTGALIILSIYHKEMSACHKRDYNRGVKDCLQHRATMEIVGNDTTIVKP